MSLGMNSKVGDNALRGMAVPVPLQLKIICTSPTGELRNNYLGAVKPAFSAVAVSLKQISGFTLA